MGALVYLGGEKPKNSEIIQKYSDYNYDVATMNKVWVFDISKQAWYEQETTGEIPTPRTEFCSVKAEDPSRKGSYYIYMIGGADFQTKYMQNDV